MLHGRPMDVKISSCQEESLCSRVFYCFSDMTMISVLPSLSYVEHILLDPT